MDEKLLAERVRQDEDRYARIFILAQQWKQGKTLEELGAAFDITRERVRQLLQTAKRIGLLKGEDKGGASKRSVDRDRVHLQAKIAKEEVRVQRYFGCSRDECYAINNGRSPWSQAVPKTLARFYYAQRRAAVNNGAAWALTFPQWKKVWDESGKWALHGRGANRYTLGRLDTSKPFEPGNAAVLSNAEISSKAGRKSDFILRGKYDSGRVALWERQEAILVMREESGKSYKDIGKVFNLTEPTARSYATSARRRRELQATEKALGSEPSVPVRGIGDVMRRLFKR